jgi:hypothetical protein
MRNSKVKILITLLFLLVICLLGIAQYTDDVLVSKLLVCSSLISSLVIFKLLNSNTLKQKNG